MSLYGLCDDCGDQATLRYKPELALDDQPRPSVCNHCRMRREERMVDDYRSMPSARDGRDASE